MRLDARLHDEKLGQIAEISVLCFRNADRE
jgi:hypothetical protein